MEIFNVKIKNGVTFTTAKDVALDPYKIVKVNKYETTKARILYCRSMDRRDSVDDLWLTDTYGALKVITDSLNPPMIEFTELLPDGTSEDVIVNPFFIKEVYASKKAILGVVTNGNTIEYSEGAFKSSELFVSGTLANIFGSASQSPSSSTSPSSSLSPSVSPSPSASVSPSA